jgi:hypothetical protein
VRAQDLDHDRRTRLRDPARLAQGPDHVVREEEAVEAGDEIERVVVPRQVLHLADTQVGWWEARARKADQRVGRVDPVRLAAAVRDQLQEGVGAAADVEDTPASLKPCRTSAAS